MELASVIMELQTIDHFRDAIEQRAPAKYQHGHIGRSHRLDDDVKPNEQNHRRKDPVAKSHLSISAGVHQTHVLIDGAKYQYTADDIHQCGNEYVRRQGE